MNGNGPLRRFPVPLASLRPAKKPAGKSGATLGESNGFGLGLDSAVVRDRMVERLRADGVVCEPVLAAFSCVLRHRFVDTALVSQAYEDTSLPIGLGQTISKPSVIARMLALLFEAREGSEASRSGKLGRVLEIGTGCGYQAALLARMSSLVISIERLRPLHEKARDNLAATERSNVRLVYGDGCHGHPPNAPYDAIVCAAGGDEVPPDWLEQMAVGGRLVAPMRDPRGAGQVLLVVDRHGQGWSRRSHEALRFVPLISGTA